MPSGILALAGVTAIDFRVGAVTVNVAEPEIVPEVAVMVAVPCATDVASPPLFMVATVLDEVVQVTELVRVCVVPLL